MLAIASSNCIKFWDSWLALTSAKNLAISYVNESLDLAALTTLHQFLRIVHPSHAGPAPSRSALTETSSPWALHQGVTNSFLNLAREQYASNGTVDPDVQVGLGTLYYMMGEYGEARDCWVAALGERPDVSCSKWTRTLRLGRHPCWCKLSRGAGLPPLEPPWSDAGERWEPRGSRRRISTRT
jgi:peroxin-5